MEYKQNKEEAIQRAKMAKEEAIQKVKDTLDSFQVDPKKIAEVFAFGSKHYKYSYRNSMLIQLQNEGATYVQSFQAWKKQGAYVNRGAKGMKILVPVEITYLVINGERIPKSKATKAQLALLSSGAIESVKIKAFSVGSVFDISQTNFPKEKYPELYQVGYQDKEKSNMLEGIVQYSEKELGCDVDFIDMESISLRGYYLPNSHSIKLNHLLNDSESLSTMIHELGHAMLHQKVEGKSTSQVELEADSLAIMIESSCGIELTENRKMHLAEHYKKFASQFDNKEEINKHVGDVFSNVFSYYKEQIELIQGYISRQIPDASIGIPEVAVKQIDIKNHKKLAMKMM